MSTISQEQTRPTRKESKNRRGNKVMAYGATIIALAVPAGIYKVHEANKDARAAAEFSVANQEYNSVTLGAGNTVFSVASDAVNKGYLDMAVPEASDFLTERLDAQMHASGILAEDEHVDVGKLQPGTELKVPASWAGIGTAEQPQVEIGTAITAKSDGKGNLIIKETDQSGHTTTTTEPQG